MTSKGGLGGNCKKFVWALILTGGLAALPLSLLSQDTQGRISGVVTDQTGGAMAGAAVTVTDVQRGTSRILTTDESGLYAAPNLFPGAYLVRAEAKGFKTFEHSGILLEVGQDLRLDVTLQAGVQTTTVTVNGEVTPVDATNATLGGTLSNETINDLPLIGRNFQNLTQLRPG